MKWILASASPRRKQLLSEFLSEFEIIPAIGEESADETLPPRELVCALARQKAEEVAAGERAKGKVVLGADTVVALDGEILGKPKTRAHAKQMLSALSGRAHEVYTGVCVILPSGERIVEADRTLVHFNALSEAFIDEYIKGGRVRHTGRRLGRKDRGQLFQRSGFSVRTV